MTDDENSDSEARRLFRSSVGPVRRLNANVVEPVAKHPPPVPRQRQLDDRQVLQDSLSDDFDTAELETGDELWFHRPGLQKRVLQKLRRGQFSVQGELDLHGLSVVQARQTLAAFLNGCRTRRLRCVRIVHGKGLGSARGKPVLKSKVAGWLRQRDEVLAYCSTPRNDGGTGAVYVLIKTRH